MSVRICVCDADFYVCVMQTPPWMSIGVTVCVHMYVNVCMCVRRYVSTYMCVWCRLLHVCDADSFLNVDRSHSMCMYVNMESQYVYILESQYLYRCIYGVTVCVHMYI